MDEGKFLKIQRLYVTVKMALAGKYCDREVVEIKINFIPFLVTLTLTLTLSKSEQF